MSSLHLVSSYHFDANLEDITDTDLSNNNELPKAVIMIDNSHDNEFLNDIIYLMDILEKLNFKVELTDSLGGWNESLKYADMLFLGAPKANITDYEIDLMKSWFSNGSKSLIISHKWEKSQFVAESMNHLLSNLTSSVRVQHDSLRHNVTNYTFRSSDFLTSSFNYSKDIKFGSSSSVYNINNSSDSYLINSSLAVTQENSVPPPIDVIFNDASNASQSDPVPLVLQDIASEFGSNDQIILSGSPFWNVELLSDPRFANKEFTVDIVNSLYNKTLDFSGPIKINYPDKTVPVLDFYLPRNNSIMVTSTNISLFVKDEFKVDSVEIYLNGTFLTNTTSYFFNISEHENGKYNITALATDWKNNTKKISNFFDLNPGYQPTSDDIIITKLLSFDHVTNSEDFFYFLDKIRYGNPDLVTITNTTWDNSDPLLQYIDQYLSQYFQDQVSYNLQTINGRHGIGYTVLSRIDVHELELVDIIEMSDGRNVLLDIPLLEMDIEYNNRTFRIISSKLIDGVTSTASEKRYSELYAIGDYITQLGEIPLVFQIDIISEDFSQLTSIQNEVQDIITKIGNEEDPLSKKHLLKPSYQRNASPIELVSIYSNQFYADMTRQSIFPTYNYSDVSLYSFDTTVNFSEGPPSAPLYFDYTVLTINPFSLELTWGNPVAMYNLEIMEFRLFVSESIEQFDDYISISPDTFRYEIKSLPEGVKLYFKIVAVNKHGPGEFSSLQVQALNNVDENYLNINLTQGIIQSLLFTLIIVVLLIRKYGSHMIKSG